MTVTKGSSAVPFLFPTVTFEGRTLTDGGVFMNLDVPAAVDRCMEIANSHSEITIDIVMTNSF